MTPIVFDMRAIGISVIGTIMLVRFMEWLTRKAGGYDWYPFLILFGILLFIIGEIMD